MSRFDIRTERLVLTPLGSAFLDTVNEYALDAENTKYMIHLPNDSAEETLAFLQSVEAEWDRERPASFEFAILYEGRHIGAANICVEGSTGELGWIVNRRYWGQGFAYEAAKAIMDHFSTHCGITHFVAHCDAENVPSWRLMEKLGMERTGEWPGRRNRAASRDSIEYQYELHF